MLISLHAYKLIQFMITMQSKYHTVYALITYNDNVFVLFYSDMIKTGSQFKRCMIIRWNTVHIIKQ